MGFLTLSSLIVTVVLSRLLSSEEFGLFSLVNAIVFFLIIIFNGGIAASIARYIALSDDKVYRIKVIKKGLKVFSLYFLVYSGIYYACYEYVFAFFLEGYNIGKLAIIIFLLALLEVVRLFVEKISHGLSRMSVAAWMSGLTSVFFVVLLIAAVLHYKRAEEVLIAKAIALFLPLPLILIKLIRVIKKSPDSQAPVVPKTVDVARYGLPLTMVLLASYGFLQADLLFLGHYWGVSYVGLYSVCIFVYVRLAILPRAIGNGLAPHMARLSKNAAWFSYIEKGILLTLTFVIPVMLFCGAEGGALLKLIFGDKYSQAAPVFVLLSIYFLMMSLLAVVDPILDFSGKASVRAKGVILGSLVNVGLDMLWVPVHHMWGAAYATLIGYGVFFIVVALNLEKGCLAGIFNNRRIRRILFIFVLLLIIVVAIKFSIPIYSTILNIGVLSLFYPALLLFLKVYGIDELKQLKQKLS